jgi:hypothetical protein
LLGELWTFTGREHCIGCGVHNVGYAHISLLLARVFSCRFWLGTRAWSWECVLTWFAARLYFFFFFLSQPAQSSLRCRLLSAYLNHESSRDFQAQKQEMRLEDGLRQRACSLGSGVRSPACGAGGELVMEGDGMTPYVRVRSRVQSSRCLLDFGLAAVLGVSLGDAHISWRRLTSPCHRQTGAGSASYLETGETSVR